LAFLLSDLITGTGIKIIMYIPKVRKTGKNTFPVYILLNRRKYYKNM